MLALLPLILSLAPEIGSYLFGPKAAATTAAVTQAITTVVGTIDPETATAALADPTKAAQLRVQLAQIAAQAKSDADADMLNTLKSQLADVAAARGQTATLAQVGSHIAWGAPAVSIVVLLTFCLVMVASILRPFPPGSETVLTVLLGMLGTAFAQVTTYWMGSSNGSAVKTDMLYNSTPITAGTKS